MKRDTYLIVAILLLAIGISGLWISNSYIDREIISEMRNIQYIKTNFASNGERIYYTATSESGKPITASMGMMTMAGMMSCVDCHGQDGKGGTIRMMMGIFEVPDIRYKTLISEDHGHEEEEHPPYTDELIKRAITKGLNPAGEPLNFQMPIWSMSEEDLNDLLEYLKSLE